MFLQFIDTEKILNLPKALEYSLDILILTKVKYKEIITIRYVLYLNTHETSIFDLFKAVPT